eukprot:3332267-Rhodomonas_salina.1
MCIRDRPSLAHFSSTTGYYGHQMTLSYNPETGINEFGSPALPFPLFLPFPPLRSFSTLPAFPPHPLHPPSLSPLAPLPLLSPPSSLL